MRKEVSAGAVKRESWFVQSGSLVQSESSECRREAAGPARIVVSGSESRRKVERLLKIPGGWECIDELGVGYEVEA